jgi:hypothetical protein
VPARRLNPCPPDLSERRVDPALSTLLPSLLGEGRNMRARIGVLTLASLIASLGCATIGHRFAPEKVQSIKIGETTKSDLLGMFGLPYRRGIEDGDSTWTYLHYRFNLFGEHLRSRDLYVRFSSNGAVASFTYNSNMPE